MNSLLALLVVVNASTNDVRVTLGETNSLLVRDAITLDTSTADIQIGTNVWAVTIGSDYSGEVIAGDSGPLVREVMRPGVVFRRGFVLGLGTVFLGMLWYLLRNAGKSAMSGGNLSSGL